MDAQAKTITQANAGAKMNACIHDFQSKMQLVESLGPGPAKPAAPQGR